MPGDRPGASTDAVTRAVALTELGPITDPQRWRIGPIRQHGPDTVRTGPDHRPTQQTGPMRDHLSCFIDGTWQNPDEPNVIDVINPAT
ncbi:MAG: hypothetical protein KA129_05810, partial [Microthrixaceae bacterium]|nr:hypothetical protein [Microthrixaceae bacterium]